MAAQERATNFSYGVFKVAVMFCLRSCTWRHLQGMPEGRVGARVCQVGDKVFVFGEERTRVIFELPDFVRNVLCFSLSEGRWLRQDDNGITRLSAIGYSPFALCQSSDSIVIAGEEDAKHFQDDLAYEGKCETYKLCLPSLRWERLPDLRDMGRKRFFLMPEWNYDANNIRGTILSFQ